MLANITAHLSITIQNQVCLYLTAARKITPKDCDRNNVIRFYQEVSYLNKWLTKVRKIQMN